MSSFILHLILSKLEVNVSSQKHIYAIYSYCWRCTKTTFASSNPLPPENLDQSGNFLKHHDRQSFCFIHIH